MKMLFKICIINIIIMTKRCETPLIPIISDCYCTYFIKMY